MTGIQTLVEFGLSIVESAKPDISPDEYETSSKALFDFIQKSISFDQCSDVLRKIVGSNEAVVRVRAIIELPEEPFPSPDTQNKLRMWSKFEDDRLIGGIFRFGLDNWSSVAGFVGGNRTKCQCIQRWSRGLNPKICKKLWTSDEDEKLKDLVRQYGENAWIKISSILGNRSDLQCKYHYKQITQVEKDANNFLKLQRTSPMSSTTTSLFKQNLGLSKLLTPPEPSGFLQSNDTKEDDDGGFDLKMWASIKRSAITLQPIPFLSPKLRLDGAGAITGCLRPIDT